MRMTAATLLEHAHHADAVRRDITSGVPGQAVQSGTPPRVSGLLIDYARVSPDAQEVTAQRDRWEPSAFRSTPAFTADAVCEFPFLASRRETDRYDGRDAIRAGFTRAWASADKPPLDAAPAAGRRVSSQDRRDDARPVEIDALGRRTGPRSRRDWSLIPALRG
jgi:hypothetical protein